MRLPHSLSLATAGLALTALTLAGCASSTPDTTDGTVRIVASTNVYGDIAQQIGGDLVSVTSFISGAAQDPHSYEASARDQLALSKAAIVIENGGGYDPFIDTLMAAAGNTDAALINATEVSGLLDGTVHTDEATDDTAHTEDDGHNHIEGFNEHVWYSFHGVEHVAEAIAAELSAVDADNSAVYAANLATFVDKLAVLETDAEALRAVTAGTGVAITEPVPLYLLEEVGLINKTPDEFSEAIEEGVDVAPLVLRETLDLFATDDLGLLAYNEQTAGAETEQVLDAAEEAGVAVVSFSETLPDGADYILWMTENLAAITAAVSPE